MDTLPATRAASPFELRPRRRLDLWLNGSVFLLGVLLSLARVFDGLHFLGRAIFFPFLMVGAGFCVALWPIVLYRSARGPSRDLAPWGLLGALLGAGLVALALALIDPAARGSASLLLMAAWLTTGAGAGSGLLLCWRMHRLKAPGMPSAARVSKSFWLDWLGVPLFIANSAMGLRMVTLLCPWVYDGIVYRMDLAFFHVLVTVPLSRWIPPQSWLYDLLEVVYQLLPAILLWVAARMYLAGALLSFRRAIVGFLVTGYLGWAFYLVFPVVGPIHHYPFLHAEGRAPLVEQAGSEERADAVIDATVARYNAPRVSPAPVSRNCMPSLHTAWALLTILLAWSFRRRILLEIGPLILLTVFATVALRLQYLTDLLFALPYVAFVWVLTDRLVRGFEFGEPFLGEGSQRSRCKALLALAGLFVVLFWALGFLRIFSGPAYWVIYLLLSAAIVALARSLCTGDTLQDRASGLAASPDACAAAPGALQPPSSRPREPHAILVLFFLSGFVGLLYELVFEKQLALIFGSTATSATTVLATYMGGLAIGARIGGSLADRVKNALQYYALAELAVGLVCLLTPAGFMLAWWAYPTLAAGVSPGSGWLDVARVLCGSMVLLIPATLMGTTMPLLARQVTPSVDHTRSRVAILYSANTLGAALGTLSTAYWILPTFGRSQSIYLATVINFGVALVALRLARRVGSSGRAGAAPPAAPPPPAAGPVPASEYSLSWLGSRRMAQAMCLAALLMGAVTFGLEVSYVHLLAAVVGNSTYAFALMLFCFLLGLGLGSLWVSRWQTTRSNPLLRLGWTQVALGLVTLVSLCFWDRIPDYFAAYSTLQFARSFPEREMVRMAACLAMLLGPTLLIGLSFPQVVSIASTQLSHLGRTVGRISAFNTVGNILGALLVGFIVLPALGSHRTITGLGCTSLAIGAGVLALAPLRSQRLVGLGSTALAAALALLLLPPGFSMARLTTGANVYFHPHPYGSIVEHRESLEGGLTSVHERLRNGRKVTTILTNGKFQGDDGPELPTQYLFALFPLLHQPARGRALVIGLGTGVTSATLLAAGFNSLDIAELSSDMALLADKHFWDVNRGALRDARTTLHLTDGRNLLLLSEQSYDLVSIEVSSVWFAGAATIYSADFYEIVGSRLADGGVLQQWVQLHHIDLRDLAAIFAAARRTFPYLHFYYSGLQGVLICSRRPAPVRLDHFRLLEDEPALDRVRQGLPLPSFLPLAGQLLLDPEGMDRFLLWAQGTFGLPWQQLASDDDNMFLEYSTPRGNVRSYGSSTRKNLDLLRQFGGTLEVHGGSRAEQRLMSIFRAMGQGRSPAWPGLSPKELSPWLEQAAHRLGAR